MNLEGKVILVTGASSGIGEACAYEFAKEKAILSLTGRNLKNLKSVKKQCIENGLAEDQVLLIQADMKIEDDIKKLMDTTIATFGKLDVLINNAGIVVPGTLEQITMANYDEQMLVNIRAPLFLSKLAIPHLKKSKGNIVNISSTIGLKPMPMISIYGMSKAAMDMLTKSLALELAPSGVRVNSVNPGIIRTPIFENAGLCAEECEEAIQLIKATHAIDRPGELKETSDAILFLASDKSTFITGHLLPVDGGRTIKCS